MSARQSAKPEHIIKTRYRGSKTKIIPAIWDAVKELRFDSVLDAFGGTGAVSYFFKRQGKRVTYNDHLDFNYVVGRALIENDTEILEESDLNFIFREKNYETFPHVIEKYFKDIYYVNSENIWLDRIVSNIYDMDAGYKQYMAFWCLFQSCITKRPFSLFHRKNLNLRLRKVERSFGNKTTWDTPFEDHFRKFAEEINGYIYDSGGNCRAMHKDVLKIDNSDDQFDLVYIDPPYIPKKGENIIYRNLYHFLEGIMDYDNWKEQIDFGSKHRRLEPQYNIWNDKKAVHRVFRDLIKKFRDSIIVVSHRSDGLPQKEQILTILRDFKDSVSIADKLDHKYALSTKNSQEILYLGI